MPVSIIMPCYNEEGNIEEVIRSFYEGIIEKIPDSEYIVIDDCSIDATPAILARLKYELPKLRVFGTNVNSGHGMAIRRGYELARKEWIFQTDSDNQFECREFWKLYKLKDSFDFIFGFRETRKDSFTRIILSRLLRYLNILFFGICIRDANCPFRLMRRQELLKFLFAIPRESLAPNIMISLLACKKSNSAEVAVSHYKRKSGKASLREFKLIKFCLIVTMQLLFFRKKLSTTR